MSFPEASVFLNDTWSFYFHDPHNNDWRTNSYMKIMDIGAAEEYWVVDYSLNDNINKGMFFLMREHVFPCWDDESNIKGGCLSLKVLKQDLRDFWNEMVAKMLTEQVLVDSHKDQWSMVNGISTSPKKHFCIIKIWVADPALADPRLFNIPPKYYGDIIYKSNMDNINNDEVKTGGGGYKPPICTEVTGKA